MKLNGNLILLKLSIYCLKNYKTTMGNNLIRCDNKPKIIYVLGEGECGKSSLLLKKFEGIAPEIYQKQLTLQTDIVYEDHVIRIVELSFSKQFVQRRAMDWEFFLQNNISIWYLIDSIKYKNKKNQLIYITNNNHL